MKKVRLLDILSVAVVTTVFGLSIFVATLGSTSLWAAENSRPVTPGQSTAADARLQQRERKLEQNQQQYQYREMQQQQKEHKWQNGNGPGRSAGMSQGAGKGSGGGKR